MALFREKCAIMPEYSIAYVYITRHPLPIAVAAVAVATVQKRIYPVNYTVTVFFMAKC